MQLLQKSLIVSALGFGLAGCLATSPQRLEVASKPIKRPQLILPAAEALNNNRPIEWYIITPDNAEEVYERLAKKGRPLVLFGLTDKGYENLALNLSDLRAFIQQKEAIIAAYDRYYIEAQKSIEEADAELDRIEEKVNTYKPEEPKRDWTPWN